MAGNFETKLSLGTQLPLSNKNKMNSLKNGQFWPIYPIYQRTDILQRQTINQRLLPLVYHEGIFIFPPDP